MKAFFSTVALGIGLMSLGGLWSVSDKLLTTQNSTYNGNAIAFAQKASRDADICIINIDGTGFRKISDVRAADSGPSYSWDGKKIVFHSERRGWWKIWSMNSDGTNIVQLTNPPSGADYDPTYSPDGKWIAFTSSRSGNEDIFIMKSDGTELKNITSKGQNQRYPRWLKDGRLMFDSNESGKQELYIMSADQEKISKVELGSGNNFMGDVSSDGRIVFSSDRDGSTDLYTANLDGSNLTKITESNSLIDYRAKWSADNSSIVFERSNRRNNSHIWVVSLDNTKEVQITKTGYNYGPTWKPE